MKRILILSVVVLFLSVSCKKRNDDSDPPLRDMKKQALADDAALVEYLETHHYNYDDFKVNPDDYSSEIELDTISGASSNKTPLIDQVEERVVFVKTSKGEKIRHKLYYLVIQEGAERRPTIVDSTYVKYEGQLLDGTIFEKIKLPVWLDLPKIKGFREALPEFKSGSFSVNTDGTTAFNNYGRGILFFPSGLAYFSNATEKIIPKYSPLIFKVSLLIVNPTDHDNDGIMSIDEDPDGDGNPLNDNTDGDRYPNYRDDDDDGDGVLTKEEFDVDSDGVPDDKDGDGIPNYLEKTD